MNARRVRLTSFAIGLRICASSVCHAVLAAAVVLSFWASASAQNFPVSSPLRPMVLMQWGQQSPPGSEGTITAAQSAEVAIGIFDTGDPANTLAPETATLVNPGFLPAVAGGRKGAIPAAAADFAVALGVNQTASGFLGATGFGGEKTVRVNQPAHTFTAINNVNRTEPLTVGQFRQVTEYYNQQNSENHISMPFVSLPVGAAGGTTRLVAQIDPENQMIFPFFYDNQPTDRALPGTGAPSPGLDDRGTSVSFHTTTDPRIPAFPRSDNPGNVWRVPFQARDFNTGNIVANFDNSRPTTPPGTGDTTSQADLAPRPAITVSGVSFIMDTGAPRTSIPTATWNALPGPITNVGGVNFKDFTLNFPVAGSSTALNLTVPVRATNSTPILGANVFNEYGQFWDFQRSELVLTGRVKPNILFSVDRSTLGLTRTGVNQENRFGPAANGNDQAAAVFRTAQSGSDALFIREGGLSLQNGDHLNALSLGQDEINRRIAFSVNRTSSGLNGTDVRGQADFNQQAGDIFRSIANDNVITPGPPDANFNRGANNRNNILQVNQELMGLGVSIEAAAPRATMGPTFNAPQIANQQDQMADFELQSPQINPLNPAFESPGILSGSGFRVYYALDLTSPSRGALSTADILINGLGTVDKWADHADIGLAAGDVIDAFALDDRFNAAALNKGLLNTDANVYTLNGIDVNGNFDLVLFSLAAGSPSLGLNFSPADLFISDFDSHFHLFATAESLGLRFVDNIVGLDTSTVPEPTTIALALFAGAGLFACRRRREAA